MYTDLTPEQLQLFDRLFGHTACMDDGCIIWLGGRANKKYGAIKFKGKQLSTHRVSYELCIGDIPEGLMVCHSCDNMICVNPDHLFLGDAKDNKHDSVQKGRHARGITSGNSKLVEYDIRQIRCLLQEGELTEDFIGSLFGVTQMTVNDIKRGKSWKHVQ